MSEKARENEAVKDETDTKKSVEDAATSNKNDEVVTCPKWNVDLKSPKTSEIYSPAREVGKSASLHGLGLFLATDRAKKLTRTGRQCATLLYEVSALHEAMAQSMEKAVSHLPTSGHPVAPTCVAVHKSCTSFGKQLQGLAICWRGSVARPLHSSLQSLGETAPSIFNRYSASRQPALLARQAALKMRSRYVKAVQEAERAIQELQNAKKAADASGEITPTVSGDGSETQSDPPAGASKGWEAEIRQVGRVNGAQGTADRVIVCVREVQSLEAQYIALVQKENTAVSQAETLEMMGLESIQHLEEERLHFFVESISRSVQAEKGALDKMTFSVELNESQDEDSPGKNTIKTITSPERKNDPHDFIKKILKTNSMSNMEEVGVMEAETLGLPEEVGVLRDKVKAALKARDLRANTVKAIAGFLEDVAAAAMTLANGLSARLSQDGFGQETIKTTDPLASTIAGIEGPRVHAYWKSLMTSLDAFAKSARTLALALRRTRVEKFDAFVVKAHKELKAAAELDDGRWKLLCDAARTETKAQCRFQQAKEGVQIARGRARSVETTDVGSESAGNRSRTQSGAGMAMTPGVSKALGTMFAALPKGGEDVMSIMGEDARRAITKAKLEEADQRENKDKLSLEAATQAKSKALQSYKEHATKMTDSFRKGDDAGWSDVTSALEALIASCRDFHSARCDSLLPLTRDIPKDKDMTKDVLEWTEKAKLHLSKRAAQAASDANASTGYSLRVQLLKSRSVYKLLEFSGADGEEFSLDDGGTREEAPGTPEASGGSGSPPKEEQGLVTPRQQDASLALPHLSVSAHDDMSTTASPTPKVISGAQSMHARAASPKQDITSPSGASNKADTEVFLAHFWSDRAQDEAPPTVIASFSCAYWPKETEGFMSPLLHGRIFLTKDKLYFVGWSDKKIVLEWKDVIKVTKEKNMMGTIDNSLKLLTYDDEDEEVSYFFGSFASREEAFQLLDRLSTVARTINELQGSKRAVKKSIGFSQAVPPDETLKKMDTVLSKKLKNVSIKTFYEAAWSEGNGTDADPLYGPWLISIGSRDVVVTDWDFATHVNPWCGEEYDQKRVVMFEFTRTTHLYIGPPVAKVKQTQYCRTEGNDKCILVMTVEFDGIPYADVFAVELRWVARRVGEKDIHVDVGVLVDFKKSSMFASKIRSGTITETKPVHLQLFDCIRAACAKATGEGEIIAEEEAEEEEVAVTAEKAGFSIESLATMAQATVAGALGGDPVKILIVCACFLLLAKLFRLIFGGRSGGATTATIEELTQTVEDLRAEISVLSGAVREMVTLMNELKEKSS